MFFTQKKFKDRKSHWQIYSAVLLILIIKLKLVILVADKTALQTSMKMLGCLRTIFMIRTLMFYPPSKLLIIQYSNVNENDASSNNKESGRKLLEVMVCFWHCLWWCFHRFILLSKLTKSCTLNLCSFLHVNHTSIKWF